jgi:subtilisin family serine protease
MNTALKASATLLLATFVSVAPKAATSLLVIDEGVDLSHDKLKAFVNWNTAERLGKAGVDDDQDGFVDDLAGWNAVSNDGSYMPDGVLKLFTINSSDIQEILDLYSRLENGDSEALDRFRSDPSLYRTASTLLGLSHGTHVAGITEMSSGNSALLQSVNVFTPSNAGADANPQPSGLISQINRLSSPSRMIASLSLFQDVMQPLAIASFLDDRASIQAQIDEIKLDQASHYATIASYVQVAKARVINLSLGAARAGIRDAVEQMWQNELRQRGLPLTTHRTTAQNDNFNFLVDGVFNMSEEAWATVVKSSPSTLFVIAAGNDGSPADAAAGNLDVNPCTPANLSLKFGNVITIAATNKDGLIADFSNYSAKAVSIGAWGTAVPSLAPGNHTVSMSGTSMASPYVAGVAAKVLAINPKLAPVEVRALLERTSRKVGSLAGKTITGGMVNPEAAYKAAQTMTLGRDLNTAVRGAIETFGAGLGLADGTEGEIHQTSDIVRSLLKKYN